MNDIIISKDNELIPEGLSRCALSKFSLWILTLLLVLGWGLLAAFLIFWKGLNQTNMNDYFGFALWITFDLAVIALGAGAFFTGFLTYIWGKKELKAIINFAVIIGFICYSGAILILTLDIGQPLRSWYGFWHPNIHSMLTEVMFCITLYLGVLMIEYAPLVLENRKIDANPGAHHFAHHLHQLMFIFAGTGTFLSFFHQGSLGGMFGVMFGRPFAFREGFFIWPWTFFLFIASAIASGPAFTVLITSLVQKVTGRKLVRPEVLGLMGKIAGGLLTVYLIFKLADTIYWALVKLPAQGLDFMDQYQSPYGFWLVIAELGIFGILPAGMLLNAKLRMRSGWLTLACLLSCTGVVFNRFVFTVVSLALPVMPFDRFVTYSP
ncbi:MAG: polysulfide reductase NrfD, partial [Deltaproteobacteria bacterium]|nr:polysulfide reductase NrfD [Deltaproteobacteria bacterium]